jgi:hypothetical protein
MALLLALLLLALLLAAVYADCCCRSYQFGLQNFVSPKLSPRRQNAKEDRPRASVPSVPLRRNVRGRAPLHGLNDLLFREGSSCACWQAKKVPRALREQEAEAVAHATRRAPGGGRWSVAVHRRRWCHCRCFWSHGPALRCKDPPETGWQSEVQNWSQNEHFLCHAWL